MVDGLVYIASFSGFLHCLDADTGEEYWQYDTFASIWGSPFVVDGKVYLGDEDGDVVILEHGKTMNLLTELNMGNSVYSTPVPANGTLFLNNRNRLFALEEGASTPPN